MRRHGGKKGVSDIVNRRETAVRERRCAVPRHPVAAVRVIGARGMPYGGHAAKAVEVRRAERAGTCLIEWSEPPWIAGPLAAATAGPLPLTATGPRRPGRRGHSGNRDRPIRITGESSGLVGDQGVPRVVGQPAGDRTYGPPAEAGPAHSR
ncbi:hypothetical protein GCM10023083_75740 [Streptomyces phyllanthi]